MISTVASIELRWGRGFETAEQKSVVKPFVKTAIELAHDGLGTAGIPLARKKRLVVDQADPKNRLFGEANGESARLFVKSSQVARGKLDAIKMAGTIFHEMVHSSRFETNGDLENMFDLAAHEGVAYVAENQFNIDLFSTHGRIYNRRSHIDRVREVTGTDDFEQLRSAFIEDCSSGDPWTDALYHRWFGISMYKPTKFYPGKGAFIGIAAVLEQVDAGRDVAEMVSLPALEVLGFAAWQ